jgi:hypothetical protein
MKKPTPEKFIDQIKHKSIADFSNTGEKISIQSVEKQSISNQTTPIKPGEKIFKPIPDLFKKPNQFQTTKFQIT